MADVAVEIVGQNQNPGAANGHDIDFGALRAQASALLDKTDEPAVVEAPVKEAVEAAPDGQVDTPSEPVPLDISDDQLVRVMVDGVEEIRPWKEAKGFLSGGMKFTKNQQTLAAERKAFEAEGKQKLAQYEVDRAELKQLLTDKQWLAELYERQFGEKLTPEVLIGEPGEIATVEQAERIAQRHAEKLANTLRLNEEQLEGKIAAATAKIEFTREQNEHAAAIQSTFDEIYKAHPILKAIPNIEDSIRFEVAKTNPQTREEAIASFQQVSKAVVDELAKHSIAHTKLAKVAATKAVLDSKSIEPAGGTPPQIEPTNFKNADGTINWKTVKANAAALLK